MRGPAKVGGEIRLGPFSANLTIERQLVESRA